MSGNLKILQHNVLSWTYLRRNELFNMYKEEDPDVILLKYHGRADDEKIKISGYQVYQVNASQEQNYGAAIAVRNNIKHKL